MTSDLIKGAWVLVDGNIQQDAACAKIEQLLQSEMTEVSSKDGGWVRLYRDSQGCYWELTYPQSHLHAGGPPQLERLPIHGAQDW